MALVEVSNLSKIYGDVQAVDGISFEIQQGEIFGLLGPNGAGKTTTINVLCTYTEPTAGEVTIAGHSVTTEPEAVKRAIGVAPQDIALYPDLNGVENLRFFGRMYDVPKARLEQRIGELLELVGLAEHAHKRVEHYSGGMKRRLNLAVGLLSEPRFLMLDEPTVGVDPQSRNAIFENIQALNRQGLTILYTTHYMEEAELLCDRVAIMDEGQIIALDTPLAQADPPHHHADHPGLLGHRRFLVPAVHDAQGGTTGGPDHPRRLGDGRVQPADDPGREPG